MPTRRLKLLEHMQKAASYLEELRASIAYIENEEMLRDRINDDDCFIISDQLGVFIFANDVMSRCLGYEPQGLVYKSWVQLLHKGDKSERLRMFAILGVRGLEPEDNATLRYKHLLGHYVKIHWYFSTLWVNGRIYALGKCLGPELRPEVFG